MSATELGLDRSGNGNNFSFENALGSDQMLDTPTNNFCTMNTLDAQTADKMSEGNLFVDAANRCCGTMAVSSGKWYFEVRLHYQHHGGLGLGIREIGGAIANDTGINQVSMSHPVGSGVQLNIVVDGSSSTNGEVGTVANGQIIGIMFDVDAQTITFKVDNGAIHSSLTNFDYSACSNMGTVTPFFSIPGGRQVIANFGQDSSFAGNEVAQGNQDSNDIGDFYYEPPSDYLALCTSNLPEPSFKPRAYFNVNTWTGDGSEQVISGVGFQPDWVWLKNTSSNVSSGIYDAIRGATKEIDSDSVASETTLAQGLKSFDTDGFTLGTDTSVGENTAGFVGYSWLAGGGAGSSNTDGSINTGSTTVSQEAGLAISTYTGNATSGATIGHGLGAVPEMIMVSNVNTNGGWNIYHTAWGNGKTGPLQSYEPISTSSNIWNDTTPTSSVFSLGNNGAINGNNQTYVAYCIKSIPGYSKVGSYVGNGSDDGIYVNLGFRPMFILVKNLTEYKAYLIRDSKRSPLNPVNEGYHADLPNAQNANTAEYDVDFLSNGFKARNDDGVQNKSGITYAYWAYAEIPFKYSNGK